ncbi:MAG: porin [Kofleriaceae bacterium]|nr:porin [Kofleriaceae bacterium]
MVTINGLRAVGLFVCLVAASTVHAQPGPLPTDSAPADAAPVDAGPAPSVDIAPAPSADAPAVLASSAPPGLVPPAPEPPPKDTPIKLTAAAGKGITFKAGDAFSLNLRARAQLRYQLHAPLPDTDGERIVDETVQVGTLRLWIGGHTLTPKLLYMIQLALAERDYRDGVISPVFDAFLDYKAHRDLSIKVGQYFVPFDRLRTVREFALQLADRPRPVAELTLDRDVGVTVYSDGFLGTPLAYRFGVFGGNGINRATATAEVGPLVVGRLELRPFGPIDDDSEGDLERRKKPGLALGAGAAANFNTDRTRSTTGGRFAETTSYYHLAADAVFKWQGFALQLEYLWRGASKLMFATETNGMVVTEYARPAQGWVAQASYTFDPPIELVGRASRMFAPSTSDPRLVDEIERLGQEYAAGANYYINGHQLKLQADWIGRSGTNGTHRFEHLVHVQIDATF